MIAAIWFAVLFDVSENLIGVGPVAGGAILGDACSKAIDEYRQTDRSYSGNELFGVAIPVVLV